VSLTVATFNPTDEATGVAIGANIVLAFSEAIARGTGNIVLKTVASTSNITFEESAAPTLTDFGGNVSSIELDPVSGVGRVAKVVKSDAAESWAGTTVSTGVNQSLPTIPLAAGSLMMSLRVWAPATGVPIRLKLEDALIKEHSVETEAMTTVANGWQTLTFDFANQASGTPAFNPAYTFSKASVFFNFGSTGAAAGAKTFYFDDLTFGAGSSASAPSETTLAIYDAATSSSVTISGNVLTINPTADLAYSTAYKVEFSAGSVKDLVGNNYAGTSSYNFTTAALSVVPGAATVPTTAPAVPTALPGNVRSLYGDGYTTVTGTDTPNWRQGTLVTAETYAGNNVLKLANFNYQGLVTAAALDVSTYTNLHIDFWSATATTIEVKLVSLLPTTKETSLYIPVSAGEWTSKDIAMSGFTAPDKTKFQQLILAAGTNGNALYVDNIYFWSPAATTTVADTTAPTVTTFSPADASTGVGVASNIILTFSESVVARSGGTIELMTDYGSGHQSVEVFSVGDATRVTISGNVVTIDPTSALLPSTGYHLGFNNALADTAGNAFSYTHGQYNFTTAAANTAGKTADITAYSWKAHTLLSGVSLSAAGTSHSSTTEASGATSFTSVTDASLTLIASRTIPSAEAAATSAAVNLQDAIAILKMIVGLEVNGTNKALSPYQALAADYDGNGLVQLTDAIGVLKHVVGLTAPEPAWRFVNELDTTVPSKTTLSPGLAQTSITASLSASSPVKVGLVGYLTGDVDGSYAGATGALDLDITQAGYFTALVTANSGLSLAQFGVYAA
jgi:hypothetical protein